MLLWWERTCPVSPIIRCGEGELCDVQMCRGAFSAFSKVCVVSLSLLLSILSEETS